MAGVRTTCPSGGSDTHYKWQGKIPIPAEPTHNLDYPISNYTTMEEIDLSASDDSTLFTDEDQVAINKVNLELRQESKLKGIVREFTIFNDIQCYQSVKKKHGRKHKFRINLTLLDPEPKHEYSLAANWLITTGITAILSFLLIYVGWFSSIQLNQNIITILTALGITFCFIAFLIALLKSHDRILFYSKFGGAPVLEFINKNPDRASFSEFIDTLSQHILMAQQQANLNPIQQLPLELKELRRLKNEAAIPSDIYESAKKRIFRNKAFTSANGV
ncbi:MAG: hypothetical protein ABFR65_06065 [Pseudomonadota bacterium]